MKSVPKLIRRFVGILLLNALLLLALNLTVIFVLASGQISNRSPWATAAQAAEALRRTEDGYCLPDEVAAVLKSEGAWAVMIENDTLEVVWRTDSLPKTVPLSYTVSDIASLTLGYIDGYPTFTGKSESGLMVLGYPKDSFWKHMWPSWDYRLIANLPKIAIFVLSVNIALILLVYVAANIKLLKSVNPITNGIYALAEGKPVALKETGLLSELAASLNRTSEILQSQNSQLRKKETARANWIAGVSHDIRTPLSMVMGYADQLKDDPGISAGGHQKAAVILSQSERMKNLIQDLNLASKLEYNMQPLHPQKGNMVAIVRQVVVDYINMDVEGRYPITWKTEEGLEACPILADPSLIKRAVGNLLQNSIRHNEAGCKIYVCVAAADGTCIVTVEDNGIGATDAQLEVLNHAPHYMVCDESTAGQRHGLGLLLVKQIMSAHGGSASMGHSQYGGFSAKLTLPMVF